MTPNEIIKELTNIAVIMTQLGDLHKAMVIREALKLLEKSDTLGAVDDFDVALAETMFTKRELAQLYVMKLKELEAIKH
jgi:hypothetical protein